MKLRINGNSIRLRLLRSEVEKLGATGAVSEAVRFGPNGSDTFQYTLSISYDADSISARFAANEMIVLVPANITYNWTKGDAVSLAAEQRIDENEPLTILIEKDFVCLDRPEDPDNADAFPRPNTNC